MRTIAINGFGRIGRAAFRVAIAKKNLKVAAINDLTDPRTLAYLLQYDTVYGRFQGRVSHDAAHLIVNGKKYPVYAEKDPARLPWKKLKIDVVLECTGVFTDAVSNGLHLKAGAKKVVLSAPPKGTGFNMLVLGTDETAQRLHQGRIISNASCTTNCISPVMQVLETKFGIDKAIMSTVHAYTATQSLVDAPVAKDLRRGRAAAANIVPSSTGAAEATTEVIGSLKQRFDGISLRVPVISGSLSDITAVLKKEVTVDQVNKAMIWASKQPRWKGILEVSAEPLVSSDIIGTTASAIVDLEYTRVVGGNLVKILAWYDNEWGYSNRLVELAMQI